MSDMKIVAVRFRDDELKQINNWRRTQDEIPNLAEAMRILARRGLRMSATEQAGKAK